ncbi:MAG: hypothetical protein OIF57_15365 [Marinobacterium sp.]|nr:hypothetical protein [Marinobacterium sp.]
MLTDETCQLQLKLIQLASHLNDPHSSIDPTTLINTYLQHAHRLSSLLHTDAQIQLQTRLFEQLASCATDPLTPQLLRQLCLDNINRPLLQLRNLNRNNPSGQQKLARMLYRFNNLYIYSQGQHHPQTAGGS